MAERRPFCADVSSEVDEPLQATASRIDHWLLVEYRGLWSYDALAGSGLSDQVKAHLREQVASLEHTRLLFIRRPDRRNREALLVFAASSRQGEERLVRMEIESYADLRAIDLGATSSRDDVGHPLFLVCTHGKHDPCCARRGRPLYQALSEHVDEEWLWQVTHVGGDRFAGNVVCLPHGLYYGRVDPLAALDVLDAHLDGRIEPQRYRGRSAFSMAEQAAENAVRAQTGIYDLSVGELRSCERRGDTWLVRFSTRAGDFDVEVRGERGEFALLTCTATTARRPRRYRATRTSRA